MTYPTAFAIGSLIGLSWLAWGYPTQRPAASKSTSLIDAHDLINAGIWALAGGLLIARLAFVLPHLSYYAKQPIEILWFGQGGLSWVGGAIGALTSLGLYGALFHNPFWILADELAIPALLLSIASWIGCLFDGCAYGIKVEGSIFASPTPDLLGVLAPRWPTQAVAAIYSLVLLTFVFWQKKRSRADGLLACSTLTLYSSFMLGLSFVRADPIGIWRGFRLDTWGALAIMLLAAICLGILLWRRGRLEAVKPSSNTS